MSYILDALKKSEQERKLGHLPDISSDHQNFHKQDNAHLLIKLSIIMSTILLCLLLVLVYLYFEKETPINKPGTSDAPGFQGYKSQNTQQNLALDDTGKPYPYHDHVDKNPKESAHETKAIEIIRPNTDRREQLIKQKQEDEQRNAALKIKYAQYFQRTEEKSQSNHNESTLEEAKKIAQQTKQQTMEEISGEKAGNESQQAPINSETTSTASNNNNETETKLDIKEMFWEEYPSIAELSPQIQEQLPAIHVSTHIYSNAESFRKVTINGQDAKKGADLGKGLILQNISEEGIIVSFKDIWFRMTALENWKK